jgi:SRSO17 transposase
VPHAWVAADDEFGRVSEFREALRESGQHYVLDVPCNTLVRDLDERVCRRRGKRLRKPPFRRVDAWLRRQPDNRWEEIEIRAGSKGPLQAKAIRARVQTRLQSRLGPEECLVVIRTLGAEPRTYYTLSNASASVPTIELVRAHAERHRIEEMLQEAKGEVGLAHYEVRSWPGWHHHMTLCLLALLFLVLEKIRLGGKNTGGDGKPGAGHLHGVTAPPSPDLCRNRPHGERSPAA